MTPTTIVLADDHVLFREGIASFLSKQPDLVVIGQANDGLEALMLTRDLQPDLVITDISMPVSDGLEATRLIKNAFPDMPILVLTVDENEKRLFHAIQAGASGYVLKGADPDEFLEAVYKVLHGQSVLPAEMTASLFSDYARLKRETGVQNTPDYDLTGRELEVMAFIVDGRSDKEIAVEMSLSVNTVKTHVRSILNKLNVTNRRQAARLAVEQGIISKT